jgi:transcriptional regulator with XRE-family HTH domain
MKRFDDVPTKVKPAARERIRAKARKAAKEIGLDELRRARRMSQEALAETMQTTQAHISRLERRADIYISTLRRYVEALGGELRIVATFGKAPVGELEIDRFANIGVGPQTGDLPVEPRVLVSYLPMAALGPAPRAAAKRARKPKRKQ